MRHLLGLLVLLLVLLGGGERRGGVRGAQEVIEFENDSGESVMVYWVSDSYEYVVMGDVKAGKKLRLNSHRDHKFEVQTMDKKSLNVFVVLPVQEQVFYIDGFQDCANNQRIGEWEEEENKTPSYPTFQLLDFQNYMNNLRKELENLTPDEKAVLFERKKNEKRRIWLNKHQPQKTPRFTEVGYAYSRLSDELYDSLLGFYNNNKHRNTLERWKPGDHHVNHWESPTYLLQLPSHLKKKIKSFCQPILETWIGGENPLEFTMMYGIRTYTNQSYLLNHVDRSATHAVSVIIQVDQQVTDDWMLEVHGHDGKVEELKLEPGQMVLYESASVIHGRPKPMNGDFYANVFVHYRPKHGWNLDQL